MKRHLLIVISLIALPSLVVAAAQQKPEPDDELLRELAASGTWW